MIHKDEELLKQDKVKEILDPNSIMGKAPMQNNHEHSYYPNIEKKKDKTRIQYKNGDDPG